MTDSAPPFERMEAMLDHIGQAVDAVSEEHESAFFTKLVLTLAHMLDDPDRFAQAIEIAKQDLDG